jgi:hypothetical protein
MGRFVRNHRAARFHGTRCNKDAMRLTGRNEW